MFVEDTKVVIRIRISKNRQHNDQEKKYKRTNNNVQNMHITKDRVIRTQLKTCVTKNYYYVRVCDSPFFIAITVNTYECNVRNVTGKQNDRVISKGF
jgi:hypothetical protein